jgi:hypothetical protein
MAIDILHPERLRVAAVVSFYMASALVVSIYLICTVYHHLTLLADGLCVRLGESPFLNNLMISPLLQQQGCTKRLTRSSFDISFFPACHCRCPSPSLSCHVEKDPNT